MIIGSPTSVRNGIAHFELEQPMAGRGRAAAPGSAECVCNDGYLTNPDEPMTCLPENIVMLKAAFAAVLANKAAFAAVMANTVVATQKEKKSAHSRVDGVQVLCWLVGVGVGVASLVSMTVLVRARRRRARGEAGKSRGLALTPTAYSVGDAL
jgi:hypothetical protein